MIFSRGILVDGGDNLRQLFGLLVCGLALGGLGGCGTAQATHVVQAPVANKSVVVTNANADANQTPSVSKTTQSPVSTSSTSRKTPTSTNPQKISAWPKVTVTKIASTPQSLGAGALAVNAKGEVYVVGGYTGQASLASVLRLVPSVSTFGKLPQLTHDAAAGFLNGQLTVFGGGQNASYNTVVRVQSTQSVVIGRLSAPLSDATAVPYTWKGTKGIALIGGYDGKVYRKSAQFVSLQGGKLVYTPLFQMPVGLRYTAVAVAGHQIYMVGGKMPQGISSAVYAWKPGDPHVQRLTTLNMALQKASAFVTGKNLIVAGGLNASDHVLDTILAIRVTDGKTRVIGHLKTPLTDMGYAQTGETGYIAGGFTSEQPMRASQTVYKLQWLAT